MTYVYIVIVKLVVYPVKCFIYNVIGFFGKVTFILFYTFIDNIIDFNILKTYVAGECVFVFYYMCEDIYRYPGKFSEFLFWHWVYTRGGMGIP